jgi:hypothetical protein
MTTVVINKPGADTTVSYDIASGDKIVFKTPLKTLKMNMVGSDMVVYWPDGGKVVLVGAGLSMFNAEDTTVFETSDGKAMTGNELLAQMGKLETVLASEIDKISAVFEKKDQDTTADSKEIQQLKSLLKEKAATPSFKAIDEVLSPTDALNPEANQSKLQDAMRKADETFRRVQDEDGFHGRYNMISAPPITPVDPGLPPPEPAKPEYFSFFVQHVGANGNLGGSGGSGQTPADRFSAESLTGSGEIYGDDPALFTSTSMQQQIVFRANDLKDFEAGLRQSGLLKGFLQASKVTLEATAGWPDGVELFYYDSGSRTNNSVTPVGNVYTFDASSNAPGLSTNSIIITIKYPGTASVGSGFNVVTKVEFIDDATVDVPPAQGGPTVAYTYNAEGTQIERFKFIDPATSNQNAFSGFAFPRIPVGTNITGSSLDDTIIPGIGQSGTTAVTLDGKGGNDKVDYGAMFNQKQAGHAPLEITMTSGLNSQVRMTVNGNKFLHSNLKNIETIVGGDGDDTLYGSFGTSFGFDGGDGLDTLDMSKASGSGQWVYGHFHTGQHKNIEKYVGSTSNYDFVTIGTGLDTSQGVVPTIDGGAGWGNRINWSGLDGALSSRRLYWNSGTVDSDGYSTAWLSPDGTASGTSYKIKNFSFLYGTQNADTVWLSSTTTGFIGAGAGDSVIGDPTTKGSLSFNTEVTLTFDGNDVIVDGETRAYSITGTSATYKNINSLGFGSGQKINITLSGTDPTQGYSFGTVAVPTIADESNSGTLDMRGMGGTNGVAFVAESYWSSSFGALGRGMSLPYLNSLALLSLSTTARKINIADAANNPGGLNLTAQSMNTVIGTNNADVLVAGFGKATLNAEGGNDILYSIDAVRYSASQVMYDDDTGDVYSSGSDVLNGGAGNDVFFRIVDAARSGKTAFRDVIDGGVGINTLVLAPSKKSDGTALNTDSEDTIRQSAVLGTDAPVRNFFGSTSYSTSLLTTGGLASIASGATGTMGATLKNIQNVMVGGGGFVADDKNVANQYWFTGTAKNTEKTAAAMLFNDDNSTETDTVTVYGGNLLVYFDGLGMANINEALVSSRLDWIGGQSFAVNSSNVINPITQESVTLGSGQVSLFALGDVGNANGRSVTVDLSGSTGAGGTIAYSGGGGVNKIWRPSLAQGGADDDIYAIYTTALGDTITGDAFGNIVFTGGGKDTVSVGAGKDTVYAAGGEATSLNLGNDNDVLEAAFYKTNVTGNTSTVDGGAGTDSLQFGLTNTGWSQPGGGRQILGVDWNAVGVDLDLTTGKATGTSLLGTGNTINFSNFENFHLTNGADTVTVNDTAMSALTGSNLIDASPLRVGGIYESATTTGYSPAGYNGANSNEKFFASNNTSIVDTIKYTGNNSIAASDFVTKGFRSFEKFDLTSSTATSFAVNVNDIISLTESRTLAIDKTASINVNITTNEGWTNTVTTIGGAQVYTFTKANEQNVVLAITG